MKLTTLAAKPKLIMITLEDEATVKEYGEPLEFWIYDRQPISRFIEIATLMTTDYSKAVVLVSDLILDEEGKPVLSDGMTLPTGVMSSAIQQVITFLGK